jgi:hypothetical protein
MAKPEFDIAIGKDGKVTVKVHGASGAECLALSDMLKQIIGQEESRTLTPEYYGGSGDVRIDTTVHGHTKR